MSAGAPLGASPAPRPDRPAATGRPTAARGDRARSTPGRAPPLPTDWPLALLWLGWAIYWLAAAAGQGRPQAAEPGASRAVHLLLLAAAFPLLFVEPLQAGPLRARVIAPGGLAYGAGFAAALLGLVLSIWARIRIGGNWSGKVGIRSEQQLVTSGPYRWVRHPIYAGLLFAVVGTAFAIGTLGAWLGVALAALAYARKIRIEEAWLVSAFGPAYESYRAEVGALLPLRGARTSLERSFARTRSSLLRQTELEKTLERLQAEEHLSPERARELREELPEAMSDSSYVLGHLGAHLAIGVVFAFDVIPLPLGTIARVLWVAGNRLRETLRGSRERAAVHSLAVGLVAAIPWVGYAAYLLPLRRESATLAWLLAQHTSYRLHGISFDDYLAAKPRAIRRAGSWLVPDASVDG